MEDAMATVFISHVREDSDTVARLAEDLSSFGITVWLDRDSIKPGTRWKDAIRDGINQGAFFIACISRAYLERSKTCMNEELALVIEEVRQRPTDQAWFIPVGLDDCQVPGWVQHVPLFSDWANGIRQIVAVIQPSSDARRESVAALIQTLAEQPASEHPFETSDPRATAAKALGSFGDPIAVPALVEALMDSNYVCVCAAKALAQIKHPDAIDPLIAVLEDTNKFWVPRGAAAVALGQLGEIARPALPALQRALQYDCDGVGGTWDLRARQAVEDAIMHITDPTSPCSLKGRGYRFEMWGIY
jgi:hypothetical protein